jgi:hypothetical protein
LTVKLGILCQFEEFSGVFLIAGRRIQEFAGKLTDNVEVLLRDAIDQEFGFDPGRENVTAAVRALGLKKQVQFRTRLF